MSGRGKKLSYSKNARAYDEWMKGKKLGRKKQQWVWDFPEDKDEKRNLGHWEKV